ncbi:hypothetical protein [Citrobacter sp. S-77]|uniref:hypothetical protein n=1 Tax=Citrobacter sp. S-77 TaxID=1080067 RepID=UPI0016816370|nr:hypothetical protein [Citrobacter sp. S-77]
MKRQAPAKRLISRSCCSLGLNRNLNACSRFMAGILNKNSQVENSILYPKPEERGYKAHLVKPYFPDIMLHRFDAKIPGYP